MNAQNRKSKAKKDEAHRSVVFHMKISLTDNPIARAKFRRKSLQNAEFSVCRRGKMNGFPGVSGVGPEIANYGSKTIVRGIVVLERELPNKQK